MSNGNKKTNKNSGKAVSGKPNKAKRQPKQRRTNNSDGRQSIAPLSQARQQNSRSPGIQMARDGTRCRVVQSELVDILQSSTGNFNVPFRLRCNPGSKVTFPWLSTMANSWETYRFRKLNFRLVGRCPTTTAGSVLMSPDYDAQDGAPQSETQMSQMKGTVESAPWTNLDLKLDPAAMNRLYKAHVTMDDSRFSTTTQDEKTLDVAQVFIGYDMDTAVKIAKIWVDYDVDLFTPQPPNLPLDQSGGSMIVGVSGQNPTGTAPSFYSNTATSPIVKQDLVQPLFQVIDNSVTNSTNMVKMLRDWTGNIDWVYNTGTSNAWSGIPSLFKNGVALAADNTSPQAFFQGILNGPSTTISANAYSTARFLEGVVLKAGDIIGLNPAGVTLANAATSVDSMLRFGANLHSFIT